MYIAAKNHNLRLRHHSVNIDTGAAQTVYGLLHVENAESLPEVTSLGERQGAHRSKVDMIWYIVICIYIYRYYTFMWHMQILYMHLYAHTLLWYWYVYTFEWYNTSDIIWYCFVTQCVLQTEEAVVPCWVQPTLIPQQSQNMPHLYQLGWFQST